MVNALISRQSLVTRPLSLSKHSSLFTIHSSLFTVHSSLLNMLFLHLKNLISVSIIDKYDDRNMLYVVNTAQ